MNPGPQIRLGTPDDAKALAETARSLFLEAYDGLIPAREMAEYMVENYNESRQQSELSNPAMATLLAEWNNKIAGFAQLHPNPGPVVDCNAEVELRRVYVARQWHGTGIAQQLVKKAASLARSFSAQAIWLAVWDENFRAINFYRKVGFRPVGVYEFRVGTLVQSDVVMQAAVKELL